MSFHFSFILAIGIGFWGSACPCNAEQPAPEAATPSIAPIHLPPARAGAKEVLIPARINTVPTDNDYSNPASEYCFKRSRSTDHFLMFWAKEYGDDPMANPIVKRRFNVTEVLNAADLSYDCFTRRLKWAPKEGALSSRYKFLIFVTGGSNGTAYGGSTDSKVGTFWTPASRISSGPYGVIAHELGHSFQALSHADGAATFTGGGAIGEMTSQFMLWQVYPEWQTFENYHLKDFMKTTHLAFLHPDNQYHSCYPLEYWSFRHGQEFIGKMWREVQRGEDPVMTYKRLTGIDQNRFNNVMFDACRRFVTWDLPRIEKVSARYANQHSTSIQRLPEGGYRIATDKSPQNYGYNAIRLKIPAEGTEIVMEFKGLAASDGSSQVKVEKAGWRYGFLAHKLDGSRVYGGIFSKPDGTATFKVPEGTRFLWMVVMGAPTEHWIRGRSKKEPEEQWPYRFKLSGSEPDDSTLHP